MHEGQLDMVGAQPLQAVLDPRLRGCQLRSPRAEFLGEGQRHRIHQMRAPGLHCLADGLGALLDGLAQVRERRQQVLLGN